MVVVVVGLVVDVVGLVVVIVGLVVVVVVGLSVVVVFEIVVDSAVVVDLDVVVVGLDVVVVGLLVDVTSAPQLTFAGQSQYPTGLNTKPSPHSNLRNSSKLILNCKLLKRYKTMHYTKISHLSK